MQNGNIADDWQCWHDLFTTVHRGPIQHVPKIEISDLNSPPWIDGEVIPILNKKDAA